MARSDSKPPRCWLQREDIARAYRTRLPDLAEVLGGEVGRASLGFSIVPVKRKTGGVAAAGDVAACKIDGRMRKFSA